MEVLLEGFGIDADAGERTIDLMRDSTRLRQRAGRAEDVGRPGFVSVAPGADRGVAADGRWEAQAVSTFCNSEG